jgi:hypothetical protein
MDTRDPKSPASPSSPSPPAPPGGGGRRRRTSRERSAARGRRLTARLCCHLEPSEHARLAAYCRSVRITPASFLRRLIQGKPLPQPVPAINREAWAGLGALGASFNQYLKAIEQGRAPTAQLDLLAALHQQLAAVRRALVGEVGNDL